MVSLYVHWPFCKSKCPYCDFNSHVREGVDQARWRIALLAELEAAAQAYLAENGPRELVSIFFGGGTPSLMEPDTVAAVIARTRELFASEDEPEVTLEANPTSVETGRLQAYRAAGVNRVSLGVQSLRPDALAFLGREHSAGEALTAVETARDIFPRISFDLIYARAGQDAASWRGELSEALAHAGDHLSLYQLTLEPGTAFMTRARQGEALIADEDTGVDLYETTQAAMAAHGFAAYEVSNHARPGGACRHNLAYWRYEDYLGIGPGAHGRVAKADGGRDATRRLRLPEKWLAAVERNGDGLEESRPLPLQERREEILMMGLRLAEGVPESRLMAHGGDGFEALDPGRLATLREEGLIALDGSVEGRTLRATESGRRRLDAVLGYLL